MSDNYDTEGLMFLRWSMFDSPDKAGSGKQFMEIEPVLILDNLIKNTSMILEITMGYMSESAAYKAALPSNDSHRIGKAIRIKCLNSKKRMKIVRGLCLLGAHNIAISDTEVYFDTDKQKDSLFRIW